MRRVADVKRLEVLKDGSLRWIQPSAGRHYFELVGPGGSYATLEWKGLFSYVATGRTAGESYTFKSGGYLTPYVTVRKDLYDQEVGRMRMRFSGSCDLEMLDGRRFRFTKVGIWTPRWSFRLEDSRELCTYSIASGFLRREADVFLYPEGTVVPDLAMLLLLGWYEIIWQLDMTAAAAAGAAAGI